MKKYLSLLLAALFLCALLPGPALASNTDLQAETPEATPADTTAPETTPGGEPATPSPGTADPSAPVVTETPGSTPTPTPSGSPTPSPVPSPTPSPTPTPTPSGSPTPSPSPSPTPVVTVDSRDLWVTTDDQNFTLQYGLSFKDAAGTDITSKVTVKVTEDGGFNQAKVGSYKIVYTAEYEGQTFTFSRIVEVRSPDEKYTLKFMLPPAGVLVGDTDYKLPGSAYALDEEGNKVEVYLLDRGGFKVNTIGSYEVTFGAKHPVSRMEFEQTLTIKVMNKEDYNKFLRDSNPLKSDSYSRYSKYSRYRDMIFEQLSAKMQELLAAMQERVELVKRAFPEAQNIVLSHPEPLLLDDSVQEDEEEPLFEQAPLGGVRLYTPKTNTLNAMEALSINNWADVLAVFVAKSTLSVSDPLDLYNLRKINFDGLDEVFFDMNVLTYHEEGDTLYLILDGLTCTDMIAKYGFDTDKQDQLEELMQPEFQQVFASLTGDPAFAEDAIDEEAIRNSLPNGLSVARESVVVTALAMEGKISYFWGGKYNKLGYNTEWGVPKRVTSLGSKTTGRIRPFGLDCSGFVSWVFINATENAGILDAIGNGSANQWYKAKTLGWDEAQLGDLAFRARPGTVTINHVGIVASKDEEGNYMIIHCSSSKNGVVLTEAWSSGFRYMRRPVLYGE